MKRYEKISSILTPCQGQTRVKWFKHYSNAHNNNSLTKLRMRYGAEGYAIYWYCLEMIAGELGESDNITFELKHDAEVVAFALKCDTLKVEEIMRYIVKIGLFENIDGTITCLKLAKYLDKKNTRNKNIHKIIDAASNIYARPRQSATNPDCPRLSPLEEKRREENKDICTNFSIFWSEYPKKRDKARSLKSFTKLDPDPDLMEKILSGLRKQKRSPDWTNHNGKFIPLPSTWLNGRRWEDDIDEEQDPFEGLANGY